MPISVLVPLAQALGTTPGELLGMHEPSASIDGNGDTAIMTYRNLPRPVQKKVADDLGILEPAGLEPTRDRSLFESLCVVE